MSYQAQTWVDEVGVDLCKNGGEAFVLVRIGNHAGPDLRGCYASAGTLARLCKMGRSTVLKHIRELVARGVLLPGDPSLTDHLPADKRPPVYDLVGGHDPGCVGGHTIRDDCRLAAGAQSDHPQKAPRPAGARSEHPPKNRRSAGARFEHPQQEEGGAGVQIETERVFKMSTNSSKDLKALSPETVVPSVTADNATSSEASTAERETGAGLHSIPGQPPAGVPQQREGEQPQPSETAVAFVIDLPGRLGRLTAQQLAPLVQAAFGDGYTTETLRAELAALVDVDRIRTRGALPALYERALRDLPPAPPANSSASSAGPEPCPDHPGRRRGRCVECALALPA
ncbi:helix-turn-helix domain-containing protein [Streptomyces hydrogenans]|uniref:helix-turn-helix domain-containing protein n=1 Tax=Streptomyces hydrogenans TaxID=1873719 RepID=UPI00382236CF